jgi:type II secretory pathway component PulC
LHQKLPPQLIEGDLILRIGGEDVTQPEDVLRIFQKLKVIVFFPEQG